MMVDFKTKKRNQSDFFYDVEYDAVLIEESIAKQYHILPSEQKNLKYSDWSKLVSGLMNDTPLGKIVEIRCETDQEIIKNMTSEQLSIRSEWQEFKAKSIASNLNIEGIRRNNFDLEKMIASMFG